MSSDRRKRFRALIRHALPYWIFVTLLAAVVFFIFTLVLRQHDRIKARKQIAYFQSVYQQSGTAGLRSAYASTCTDSGFLRLEGAGLELILFRMDSLRSETVIIPDLPEFPVYFDRVWTDLRSGGGFGPWTTVSISPAHRTVLQIGINSMESLTLLRKIGIVALILLPVALLLCAVPAWFTLHRNTGTIRNLTGQILDLTNGVVKEARAERNIGPAEARLTQAVQQQMARHQRLTKELQEAMDNVAHDLRTPITRLRSIAEYGLHKEEDNEHLREALADCLEESDRLLSMLNTMLHVAEAEADTVGLDLQPILLEDTVNDVLDLYSIIAEEQQVVICFTPEPDLMILADRQRITQVWANLVDNAIKYGSSEITVSTRRQGNMAEVQIRDNGMGISKNEISRIWDRLFRGDRSRSKSGLGLGLTLVRAMIKNHHGSIKVSSTLNKGTVFTVQLPVTCDITD